MAILAPLTERSDGGARDDKAGQLAPRPPSVWGVLRGWARSTPGWLRLFSGAVALLIIVAVVVGIVVSNSRRSNSATARATVGNQLIDAQSLELSLSDADTTAAGSYLAPGVGAGQLTSRYQNDLAQAAASLTRLSGATTSAEGKADLQTLATDVPIFAGLVERAQVNVEQGQLVGGAYLGEANSLMRDHILPAADDLYQVTLAEVNRADAGATSGVAFGVAVVALSLALLGLVLLQWRVSRQFRRTFNLAMVAATLLVLVALVWATAALVLQGRAVSQARREGSDPIATLTEARILAQELRADDELTLVTRDTDPSYQTDYGTKADVLEGTLGANPAGDVIADTRRTADSSYTAFRDVHQQIRNADAAGKPATAIETVVGSGEADLPAVADRLERDLATGVTDRSNHFATVATSAIDDLWGLAIGLLLLGAAAAALVIYGARTRLREYR